MKRCPACNRVETDETLKFCRADGATLVSELSAFDRESETIQLGSSAPNESATHTLPPTSDRPVSRDTAPTTALSAQPVSSGSHEFRATTKKRLNPKVLVAIGVAIVVGIAALAIFSYRLRSTSAAIQSIAVMPFVNGSGDANVEYLSDGLTDSIIFRFSQLPNVKVSPTSSVMRFKGSAKDVAEIAKDLDVDAVLTGRLMKAGDDLTISVQLIDARTKKLVWAEQYDRKMADFLATQREIATTLTQKMQLRFAGDERGITKKYTSSNDAYQLYLKGRYHWSRRTKDDILKAIDNYKKAIDLDPNFALAYAATAEAYNSMGKNPDVPPKDCIPLAKAAATRALEIDPMLPQAHSALADSLALYDWDWAESERHFKKALELDPNISYTHVAYGGSYLDPIGKPDEAVTNLERAVALEPLATINNCILTTTYIYARKYDKALTQGRNTYDLDPTFPFAPHWLGFALIANKKYDEAIAVGRRVSPDSPFGWMSAVVIAQAYATQGKRAEAEQQIALLRELAKTRYVRPYYIASVYAALGDKDKAFAELERSFAERDCYLGRLTVDPFMDPLRDDPRFKNLLKRMNLPA
jgi:TolB-like protein/Tfp pilus assembly protein PilF